MCWFYSAVSAVLVSRKAKLAVGISASGTRAWQVLFKIVCGSALRQNSAALRPGADVPGDELWTCRILSSSALGLTFKRAANPALLWAWGGRLGEHQEAQAPLLKCVCKMLLRPRKLQNFNVLICSCVVSTYKLKHL